MLPSLALSAALLAPAAPMPRDATPTPSGPPPQVIYFSNSTAPGLRIANAPNPPPVPARKISLITYATKKVEVQQAVVKIVNGKQQIERVKREVDQRVPTVKTLGERREVFTTSDRSTITAEEAHRRFANGAVALISMDGKPVDAGWLRVMDRDVISIHSPEITSPVSTGYNRVVRTPAPRLAYLVPDADGTIRVAANAIAPNPGLPNNVIIAGNGNAQIVLQANINGVPVNANAPIAGQTGEKTPLDQISFEAYTANGDSVTKDEALRRLKAGGIVAIAGSNQKPDEAYLKAFTPNLLVLVAAELVVPASGRSGMVVGGGGIAQPIQLQPLPAVVPPPAPAKPGDDENKPDNGNKPVEAKPLPRPIVRPIRAAVPEPVPVDKTPKEAPKS